MLTSTERRRSQRFPLDLPLEVRWQEGTDEFLRSAAIRDISASGIYFLVDRALHPESKAEFYVRLQVEGGPRSGVLLHCLGSIVRVEPSDPVTNRVGVAARIDRYRFVRPGEAGVDFDSPHFPS
jgi:hypothetical protein